MWRDRHIVSVSEWLRSLVSMLPIPVMLQLREPFDMYVSGTSLTYVSG